MEGAVAASSPEPEPVPGIQQAGEEEELPTKSATDRQGLEQGRAASFSPQPSPEHSFQSSPQPSSESAFGESPHYPPGKVQEARGRLFDHNTGGFDSRFVQVACAIQHAKPLLILMLTFSGPSACLSHDGVVLLCKQHNVDHRALRPVL